MKDILNKCERSEQFIQKAQNCSKNSIKYKKFNKIQKNSEENSEEKKIAENFKFSCQKQLQVRFLAY